MTSRQSKVTLTRQTSGNYKITKLVNANGVPALRKTAGINKAIILRAGEIMRENEVDELCCARDWEVTIVPHK